MERAINARPVEQDIGMSIANDTPESDLPWYRMKSSIVMITVTLIAFASVVFDYIGQDNAPAVGFRLVDNGTISNSATTYQR